MKYYVVVDLEMCIVKGAARKKMAGMRHEIIQIGAVLLNNKKHIVEDFSTYVKPGYGALDSFIEDLTGITADNLEQAPNLRVALTRFTEWIGDRNVTVMSWSDSDYQQLINEMRIKKIKNHKVQGMLDEWIDFQRSFDKMLGLKKQFALEDAMKIGRIQPMGRMHDGLCDAYNTARLYMKVQRQPAFNLELVPISDYYEKPERLSFSMGELFTPELLAQFEDLKPVEEIETNTNTGMEPVKKNWGLQRRIYGFFKGSEAVTEENWNKYLFCREMKRIDIIDFFKGIFSKNKVVEAM